MEYLLGLLIPGAVMLIALLVAGLIIARLYNRSTRGTALVRTGSGGLKVIMDGGCFVIPVLHEVMKVNMQTVKLEVRRVGENALITLDSMRVDTCAEFFVRVEGNAEAIAAAAQTLGAKTFDADALREMVEGKVVDALRSVAATADMQDLHQNRSNFVQQVQQSLSQDLKTNGLMLEAVSLTSLDQTNFKDLDPNNVFNARALSAITQITTDEAKKRAVIEAEGKIAIAASQQSSNVQALTVTKELENARVTQSIELSQMRARETAEAAKVNEAANKQSQTARIEREQAIGAAQIASEQQLSLANQKRQIAISLASEEESLAAAKADVARAAAVEAAERVETSRQIATAERQKRIQILNAEEKAERDATEIRIRARADREAAEDRAAAVLAEADAEARKIQILAQARKEMALAEAEGQ